MIKSSLPRSVRAFVHLVLGLATMVACSATPPSGDAIGSVSSAMNGPNETWAWRTVPDANVPVTASLQPASDLTTTHIVSGISVDDNGGSPSHTNLSAWDGTTWSSVGQIDFGASFAYDWTRGVIVAVGHDIPGNCGESCEPDDYGQYFWSSDGTTLAPSAQPTTRAFPSMTYDGARARVVLFGGVSYGSSPYLTDTWQWDGTTWTNVTPASGNPPGAYPLGGSGNPIVFDAGRSKTVMLVAPTATNGPVGIWEWDGTNWANRTPSTGASPASTAISIAYDVTNAVSVVTSEDTSVYPGQYQTWTWDGTVWTDVTPDDANELAAVSNALAYDAASASVVDYQLRIDGSENAFALWSGTEWTFPATSTGVPNVELPLVYDTAHGHTLAIGSYGDWTYAPSTTTWTYTFRSPSAPGPLNLPSRDAAYDVGRSRTVGFAPNATSGTQDIWEFDGTTWSSITPSGTKPGSGMSVATYDSVHGAVDVIVTGSSKMEIWEWNGTAWTNATPASGGPSLRESPGIAYDATAGRQRLVLYGGYVTSSYGWLTDTWLWDGTNWANPTPATRPTSLFSSFPALTYLPDLQRVLLEFNEETNTFEWDGTNWTKVTSSVYFDGAPVVYDSSLHELAAISGYVQSSVNFFGRHGGACTSATDSTTGYCVDGVSCDNASCGICQACNLSGSAGTCATVTSADDPDTCGASFNGSTCDSQGSCKLLPGSASTSLANCLSSPYITDGACCSVVSCGFCLTCDSAHKQVPANDGNCAPQRMGLDDANECGAQVAATCGQTGTCDGTGACQLYAAGVSCGAMTCTEDGAVGPTCDGMGICAATATPTSCGAYVCEAVVGCLTSCTSDTNCVDGDYCASGVCVAKKSAGSAASTANECGSGYVVDGVCCLSPSCGTCQTCDGAAKATPANDGMCAPEAAGTDTKNECASTDSSTCHTTGACDGNGLCAIYAKGTSCGTTTTCAENRAVGQVCDGAGAGSCVTSASGVDCTPYACTDSKGCLTACAANSDCVTPYVCAEGKCIAAEVATCDGNHTLTEADGTTTDCSPYKCAGNTCRANCSTVTDCVTPFICGSDSECVLPATSTTPTSSGCSCDVGARSRGLHAGLGALVLLAALTRRRRRPPLGDTAS